MIKKYIKFINEIFRPTETDSPDSISKMNRLNDLEKFISEYNQKKSIIENIYRSYKDDNDLISKLKSNKLISSDNIKELKFENPFIEMWARICEKKRQIGELESKIKDTEEQIKLDENTSKDNTMLSDTLSQSIQSKKDSIKGYQEKIKEIGLEIQDIEKKSKDKLMQMKKDVELSKKELKTY